MPGKFVADRLINWAALRHQVRLAAGMLDQDGAQVRGCNVGYVEALGASVALYQRNDRHLAARSAADASALPSMFVGFLAANVGFVNLDNLVLATKRIGFINVVCRFAQTMK